MSKKLHNNVPKRLLAELKQAGGNERELARRRGVNILYVSQLLCHGIEPTDKTETGREVRVKLFMPRRKLKPRAIREYLPGERETKKKIASLARDTRHELMTHGIFRK